ncbi:MAG: dipeptidase [Verrucomicrobia bacterium]|nr:dipeptidase [Verrucomicrobiota bacterium]
MINTGIVDLHFDLPMHLYAQRHRPGVLATELLPEFRAGGISVVVASVYLEERFLPDALHVALDQLARVYAEVEESNDFAICRSYEEIERARAAGKIALVLGVEGAEPLGSDIDLLRVFYELGLRVLGLTHARRNAAATGAAFSATASAANGLTDFGRELVRESERLGIVIDLAHINAAGFDEVLRMTTKPPLVSHTNARRFYNIERNISDKQIREIGTRGGLIGINSVLVSSVEEEATLDRYVDHIQHVIDLASIDSVAIGFDFFEFIHRGWSGEERTEFHRRFPGVHFVRGLANHADAGNLMAKLIERGFDEEQIEKILYSNAMRFFQRHLQLAAADERRPLSVRRSATS